jgi:hypothetical protein
MSTFQQSTGFASLLLLSALAAHSRTYPTFESATRFYGDHPDEVATGWALDAQGVTHDATHWFITQEKRLWKIPVTTDLADVEEDSAGVSTVGIPGPLADLKYDHYGDLAYFSHQGTGFLFIPITGSGCNGVAVFRSSDLEFVGHDCFPDSQFSSWIAVHPDGYIYTAWHQHIVKGYQVDWNLLHATPPSLVISEVAERKIKLKTGSGGDLILSSHQGGEFSPSGKLLFIVNGFIDPVTNEGIHVIDVETGREIERSTKGGARFNFQFTNTNLQDEEPEGMTWWDLDDGRAPGIRGSLHVILLDNEAVGEQVYMKHYSLRTYVDTAATSPETGFADRPFNTFDEAFDTSWNGSIISVKSGNYPDTGEYRKQVWIETPAGEAHIGE